MGVLSLEQFGSLRSKTNGHPKIIQSEPVICQNGRICPFFIGGKNLVWRCYEPTAVLVMLLPFWLSRRALSLTEHKKQVRASGCLMKIYIVYLWLPVKEGGPYFFITHRLDFHRGNGTSYYCLCAYWEMPWTTCFVIYGPQDIRQWKYSYGSSIEQGGERFVQYLWQRLIKANQGLSKTKLFGLPGWTVPVSHGLDSSCQVPALDEVLSFFYSWVLEYSFIQESIGRTALGHLLFCFWLKQVPLQSYDSSPKEVILP